MSLATVHYLSMNVHSGQMTVPGTITHGVSANFTISSLTPTTSMTINWGDGSGNTVASTDGTGSLTSAHTYASAGTDTITVTETTGGRVVGKKVVTVT